MPIPPEPIVRGAHRWVQLVPSLGVAGARALLSNSRDYGDLTATQYAESFEWAVAAGLFDAPRTTKDTEHFFEGVLLGGAPPWLLDADLLVRDEEEIPDDALSAAEALGISPGRALTCIRRAWGMVDTEARRAIGDRGEHEILNCLAREPQLEVDHVASWSDAHGYDIEVTDGRRFGHLEVKATTRTNRMGFFLSRNEFETMLIDEHWQLVLVLLDQSRALMRVYSVSTAWIAAAAPKDGSTGSRWESSRFNVPLAECMPGVPSLRPMLNIQDSPLISGVA